MNKFVNNLNGRKLTAILAGIFVVGALIAYGLITLGGPPVWRALAQVLPLPAATVEGHKVNMDAVTTAQRLGSEDPLSFAIRQTAVIVLADQADLSPSEQEVSSALTRLPEDWEQTLESQNVAREDFIDLYVIPQILKEKLIVKNNTAGEKVDIVKNELIAGKSFSEIAEKYSDDKATAVFGGEMGYVSENDVDPMIWERAISMENGQWTGPVNTPEGFIFIKRILRLPAKDSEPEKLNLQVIVINEFDFDSWLAEQMQNMSVKVYI